MARSDSFQSLVRTIIGSSEFSDCLQHHAAFCGSPDRQLNFHSTTPEQNEGLALREFAAGAVVVTSTPRQITLESTSRCNLRCVMCPHAIDAVKRPKHLEPELAASLEVYVRRCREIQLHGIGEPLASPAFWQNLKMLAPECESYVNTNMTVLDGDRLTSLLESNLKCLNVSLDAARPETYRRIRGYSFDEVVRNIGRFIAKRDERGQYLPRLHMNMTLMRSNIEEVVDFIDLAATLGADLVFLGHLNRWSDAEMQRYLISRDGWIFDYRSEGLWNFPELSNEWLHKAEQRAKERNISLMLDFNKDIFFGEAETSSA